MTSEDDFPCGMVSDSRKFEVICMENQLARIVIRRISAADVREARRKGEGELRSLMGFLSLKLGRIPEYHGGSSMWVENDDGSTSPAGTRSNSLTVTQWPMPTNTSLVDYERIANADIEKSLALYYRAKLLNQEQNVPEAYLSMFLALETLTAESQIDGKYAPYKYIRHAIVHKEISDQKATAFLQNEFHSTRPDWEDSNAFSLLVNWYDRLGAEVEGLLRSEVV